MPYGLHWEWRGFGSLDSNVTERITKLRPAYTGARTVTDRYIWSPGITTNIKLRSWSGGASLKFKRLVREDAHRGLQLWMEREEEDHPFPIAAATLANLSDELNVRLSADASRHSVEALVKELRSVEVKVVRVVKSRRLFIWWGSAGRAFVDLGELRHPVQTHTVGIEDGLGISDVNDDPRTGEARDLVLAAKDDLGLPGDLTGGSYLEVVASWAERGDA